VGSIQKSVVNTSQRKNYNQAQEIISQMQCHVQISYGDLNNDGMEDLVACEFGDLTGDLVWYQNLSQHRYSRKILRAKPGAVNSVLKDVNGDGCLDI
jgi:hypothetical protein